MAKKQILVICEQSSSGHRLDYVSLIANFARTNGLNPVLLTSAEAKASPEFARMSARPSAWQPASTLSSLEHGNSLPSQLRNSYRILRYARRHGRILIIPNVDEKLPHLLILRPFFRRVDVRGIIMRPPDSASRSLITTIKRIVVSAARRLDIHLVSLSSPFDKVADDSLLMDPSGILDMPPAEDPESGLSLKIATWKAADPRPVVGIVGVLNERKSVLEVIDAFSERSAPPEYRLLVAGQPSEPTYRSALEQRARSVPAKDALFLLSSLSDAELSSALDATDMLALLYTNKVGSSGFLAHGIRRGQKVVGLNNIVVNRAIKTYSLGAIATGTSSEELLSAFNDAWNTDEAGTAGNLDLQTDCSRQWHALTRP